MTTEQCKILHKNERTARNLRKMLHIDQQTALQNATLRANSLAAVAHANSVFGK